MTWQAELTLPKGDGTMRRRLWILAMAAIAVGAMPRTSAATEDDYTPSSCEAVSCTSVQLDCYWECTVCEIVTVGGGRVCDS